MANLPEKILKQRLRLQLQSLESPSELPRSSKFSLPAVASPLTPMTDLAVNLQSSSLTSDNTPSPALDSKRRLALDSSSSDSNPSPSNTLDSSTASNDSPAPMRRVVTSPLTGVGEEPTATKRGFAGLLTGLKTLPCPARPRNKENLPSSILSKSPSYIRMEREEERSRGAMRRSWSLQETRREGRGGVKRTMFTVLEEEDSRDSGYYSPKINQAAHKRSRTQAPQEESLQEMLANCSPQKSAWESEGLVALPPSPPSPMDGFDVTSLPPLPDSPVDQAPGLASFSFLDRRLVLPSHLEDRPAFLQPQEERSACRPQFRRVLSLSQSSPLSSRLGFRRPEVPREGGGRLLLGRKRGLGESCPKVLDGGEDKEGPSSSATYLGIMRSCQVKDSTPDILPDSSRLYLLPSLAAGSRHPSLRAITADTLAKVLTGHYSSTIRSCRVVDARYKFEYEGGHIRGAENWQHGEDGEFLAAFLPSSPLAAAPPPYDSLAEDCGTKRDILIFHCEFSSQRGPDFYMKLRERDRQLNKDVYPGLYYPECYLLHLGYKEFWRQHPSLCTGGYTQMTDPLHEADLRRMRVKSKSWAGGTVARTGRLGRLKL